jgi:acyl-CoA dehydrogenase
VVPYVNEWEEKGELPRSIYEKFGEMGFFGLPYAEHYGGLDLDFFYSVIFMEEMAKIDSGGTGAALGRTCIWRFLISTTKALTHRKTTICAKA